MWSPLKTVHLKVTCSHVWPTAGLGKMLTQRAKLMDIGAFGCILLCARTCGKAGVDGAP